MNIRKTLPVFALLLILTIVLFIPQFLTNSQTPSNSTVINVECSLNNGNCSSVSPAYGEINVSLSPLSVPAFKPLLFEVKVASNKVEQIAISLEGKDMYMGPNSIFLNLGVDGVWSGSGMIPLCSVDKNMTWIVKLTMTGTASEAFVYEVKSSHE